MVGHRQSCPTPPRRPRRPQCPHHPPPGRPEALPHRPAVRRGPIAVPGQSSPRAWPGGRSRVVAVLHLSSGEPEPWASAWGSRESAPLEAGGSAEPAHLTQWGSRWASRPRQNTPPRSSAAEAWSCGPRSGEGHAVSRWVRYWRPTADDGGKTPVLPTSGTQGAQAARMLTGHGRRDTLQKLGGGRPWLAVPTWPEREQGKRRRAAASRRGVRLPVDYPADDVGVARVGLHQAGRHVRVSAVPGDRPGGKRLWHGVAGQLRVLVHNSGQRRPLVLGPSVAQAGKVARADLVMDDGPPEAARAASAQCTMQPGPRPRGEVPPRNAKAHRRGRGGINRGGAWVSGKQREPERHAQPRPGTHTRGRSTPTRDSTGAQMATRGKGMKRACCPPAPRTPAPQGICSQGRAPPHP